MTPANQRVQTDALAERNLARWAVKMKAALLTLGLNAEESVALNQRVNASRRHLYDYGASVPEHEIPYEIVLGRLQSLGKRPITARVRYNRESPLSLRVEDGVTVLSDRRTGTIDPVEVPDVPDYRDLEIDGMPLENVVQRLGYDLLGIVPTNHCSYYNKTEQCVFCEIVETFEQERSYPTYRKSVDIAVRAGAIAAASDPSISCITFNGGQLASYDATTQLGVDLLNGIRAEASTASLDATIAIMPPDDLSRIADLKTAGLNQLFFNTEVMQPDFFPVIAPGKAGYGLERMFEAMDAALDSFGKGRIYSNLVYGVQSLPHDLTPTRWNPERENELMLEATDELLAKDVVATFTVYHSAGYNRIGRIQLDTDALHDFVIGYGQRVWDSQLIKRERDAVLFTIGSLPNTMYNDGWLVAELEQRVREDSKANSASAE